MKKYIFFDFFGVICSEISPIWFKRFFNEEEAMIIKEEIMSKGDLGLLNEEEIYGLISKRMNIPVLKIKDDWNNLIKINKELVKHIKELKNKYKIYLLSNAIDTFLRRILDKNNLYCLFDKIYISSEIKLAKPSLDFFNYVLKKENINPSDVIFIDDNLKNVNAAKEIGIESLVFKDVEVLKSKL